MLTVGNVDRYIDRYIGRHSIDIAVDSRSPVDRQSANYRSTGDRLSTDWRSRGGRLSIDSRRTVDQQSDKPSAEYRSIFRRRTSTEYRSYVGGISVNCRWYVGQLSVAYRSTVGRRSVSCVNLAGESNGFPFERLSNVIMLLGKMLQCEARLLYEANRWALQTMGMVIFSFVPIVSSIGQVSAKCRPSVGQVSVKYRSSIGEVSAKCPRGIGDLKSYFGRYTSRPTIDWLSTDYRLSSDWVAIECRSTVNRLSTEWRSSGDRVSIECRPLRRPI